MSQLLQLDADLPNHFPGHKRLLHVLTCRRKACSKRDGSIRALRSSLVTLNLPAQGAQHPEAPSASLLGPDLGRELFGATNFVSGTSHLNPFRPAQSSAQRSPTSTVPAPTVHSTTSDTHHAEGEIISQCLPATRTEPGASAPTPRPEETNVSRRFSFPTYFLDAEIESLDEPEWSDKVPRDLGQLAYVEDSIESPSAVDGEMYESTLDKTFQRFADRLSQNPLQVLRYEFKGEPLLYSEHDETARLFRHLLPSTASRTQTAANTIPRCQVCGKDRVFELQVTPQAIAELEKDNEDMDGMEWGTLILGVCVADCQPLGTRRGEVSHVEEWVGVQWEDTRK